jgi:hypothetical protein
LHNLRVALPSSVSRMMEVLPLLMHTFRVAKKDATSLSSEAGSDVQINNNVNFRRGELHSVTKIRTQ